MKKHPSLLARLRCRWSGHESYNWFWPTECERCGRLDDGNGGLKHRINFLWVYRRPRWVKAQFYKKCSGCGKRFGRHTLRGEGFDASEDGTGRGVPLVPVAFNWQGGGTQTSLGFDPDSDLAGTLQAHQSQAIAFSGRARGDDGRGYDREPHIYADGTVGTLDTVKPHCVAGPDMAVRRLTPRECERLQGFPDDYTRIPDWNGWRAVDEDEDIKELRAHGLTVKIAPKTGIARVNDPDGPRYKALGNSWAVPCARWIGERIDLVDAHTL